MRLREAADRPLPCRARAAHPPPDASSEPAQYGERVQCRPPRQPHQPGERADQGGRRGHRPDAQECHGQPSLRGCGGFPVSRWQDTVCFPTGVRFAFGVGLGHAHPLARRGSAPSRLSLLRLAKSLFAQPRPDPEVADPLERPVVLVVHVVRLPAEIPLNRAVEAFCTGGDWKPVGRVAEADVGTGDQVAHVIDVAPGRRACAADARPPRASRRRSTRSSRRCPATRTRRRSGLR